MTLNLNPWRGLKGLPREIWVLFMTTLVNRAGTMALPFLVLYLTRSRGLSAGQAGLTLGVYGVGAMITAPISGALTDRIGSLLVMKGSLVFSALLLFLFPFIPDYRGVLLLTFLWAMANEAFRPASLSATAEYVAPENRKTAMAVGRVAINLGMSIDRRWRESLQRIPILTSSSSMEERLSLPQVFSFCSMARKRDNQKRAKAPCSPGSEIPGSSTSWLSSSRLSSSSSSMRDPCRCSW